MQSPAQIAQVPQTLPTRVGAGALNQGSATLLGLGVMLGGGIGGGLLGAKLSSKHQVGLAIAGTLLGSLVVAPLIGGLIASAAGGVEGVTTPPRA